MSKRHASQSLEEAMDIASPASKRARVSNEPEELSLAANGMVHNNGQGMPYRSVEHGNTDGVYDQGKGRKFLVETDMGNEENEENESAVTTTVRQSAPIDGYSDLYLDTINRMVLDFDFEKLCSVTLSNINVYACLVCGKYYQGRGPKSQAYFHALEEDHHVYINMKTKKVFVLPEGYEVRSVSLEDIKFVVDPHLERKEVMNLDKEHRTAWDLSGRKYIPGYIGMNNIKANDYFNTVIQALSHVQPLRNFFMLEDLSTRPQLAQRFSILVRKIWNPRAFKAHVSPHELLQEIALRSNKRFSLTNQSDPVEFLSWFLNNLHLALGGSRTKPGTSIVQRVFQGSLKVESQQITARANANDKLRFEDAAVQSEITRFLILTLDLPPPPLFQDELDKNFIPQVQLTTILQKYDGIHAQEQLNRRVRYRLLHPLPPYLLLHVKRFSKNKFASERNPTIVTFQPRSLDMSPYVEPNPELHPASEPVWYDLVANITHEAVRTRDDSVEGEAENKIWRVQLREKATDEWVEVQDLFVEMARAELLSTKESYLQVWERRKPTGKGKEKV